MATGIQEMNLELRTAEHTFCSIDGKRDFVMYNANIPPTHEPVYDCDMVYLTCKPDLMKRQKSEAWSCGCQWFFVIQDNGIYLFNVYTDNVIFCRKRSFEFIQHYLNAPAAPERKTKSRN